MLDFAKEAMDAYDELVESTALLLENTAAESEALQETLASQMTLGQ
jgi:hypothetical protein